MSDLSGKTALVTGASRGIGRASAIALAKAGAQVVVHFGRATKEAEAVIAEIRNTSGRADLIAADLAAPDGAHTLAKQVRGIVGDCLDILVLNAGVSKAATIEDTTLEDFDHLFAVNVRAPFFLLQQLLQILRNGSNVVLLSSLGACTAVGTLLSAYSASKGAVDALVKALRRGAGPARHPRQRGGARRDRHRDVELLQNRGRPQLHPRDAGIATHRRTGRYRIGRRLPRIRRRSLDHWHHHPRRRRLEALKHQINGEG
jgi:NADP-dependent 3-hydroxy acid dehydrogenase YdfG